MNKIIDFRSDEFQDKLWQRAYPNRERDSQFIGMDDWATMIGGGYAPRTVMTAGRYVNNSLSWTIPKGLKKLDVKFERVSFKQPDPRTPNAVAGFFLKSGGQSVYIGDTSEDTETTLKIKTVKMIATAFEMEEAPATQSMRFIVKRGRSQEKTFQIISPRLFHKELRRIYIDEAEISTGVYLPDWTAVDAERLDSHTVQVYLSAGTTPNVPDFDDLVFNLTFEVPLTDCQVGFFGRPYPNRYNL